jgi:uncharacterized phage infection (PIP) family protein YhgE
MLLALVLCSCSHRTEDCAALSGAAAKIPANLEVPSKANGDHTSRAQAAKAESRAAAASLDTLNGVHVQDKEGKDLLAQLVAALMRCREAADKIAAANDVMAQKADGLRKLPRLAPQYLGEYRMALLTNALLRTVRAHMPNEENDRVLEALDVEFGKGPKVSINSPSKDLEAMAERVSKVGVTTDKGKAAIEDLAKFLRGEAEQFKAVEKANAELLSLEKDEAALLHQAADANADLKTVTNLVKTACSAK